MRINGFHQISAFYSIVFSQKYDFKPQHISLYMFLLNQNNRNNWVEWFKCPIDLGMTGSCIGSKKTYYQCLDDLQAWGLLVYQKGENMWKAPKIKIEVLKLIFYLRFQFLYFVSIFLLPYFFSIICW